MPSAQEVYTAHVRPLSPADQESDGWSEEDTC